MTLLGGAIASEQQRASDAGKSILAAGGNAVDAIIATILCVNVIAPYHSDIGGGGFAIIRTSSGAFESLNFRHKAPAAATNAFYRDGADSAIGGAAVAVPGQMRGLEELHKRHGRLPWQRLFQPAINLARDGIPVGAEMVHHLAWDYELAVTPKPNEWMKGDPEFANYLLDKDGQPLALGEKWYRPGLAGTLEQIALKGSVALYEGEVAEAIVKVVQERGGLMTLDDLRTYDCEWNTPLTIRYRDYTLASIPAPASGAILLSALGTLTLSEPAPFHTVEDLHRLTETLKLAYGQRVDLGDPNFVSGLEEKQAYWLSERGTAARAALISEEQTHSPDYYKASPVEIKYDNGTSNITAADASGLVVSITTTIGMNWGSRIMVPKYGFILNNNMEDFSVEGKPNSWGVAPQTTNFISGGKRPLSSNCPYIVTDSSGRPVLAGGAAGGPTIIGGNIQVVRNVLDYGMSAHQALAASRIHNQLVPNITLLEPPGKWKEGGEIKGFTPEQVEGLKAKGHEMGWFRTRNHTEPCAIGFQYDEHGKVDWEPAGEPRRESSGGSVFKP